MADDRNCRHERFFMVFTAVAFLWRKAAQASTYLESLLIPLLLRKEKGGAPGSFVVDMRNVEMHRFCLLTSMEPILIPNCSLLCYF